MISSTRSSWVASIVGGERVRVDDLAVRVDPLGAQLRERAPEAPRGLGARRTSLDCGATIRKLAGPCAARSRTRSRSSCEITVSFATHEHVLLDVGGVVVAATTCRTGTSPAAS